MLWTCVFSPASGVLAAASDLLWDQLEEAQIDDMKEFSDLFSRQVVERKPTKKKEEKPSKVQAMKILDSKRSQNVGILSSSLHVDFSEIENGKYLLLARNVQLRDHCEELGLNGSVTIKIIFNTQNMRM